MKRGAISAHHKPIDSIFLETTKDISASSAAANFALPQARAALDLKALRIEGNPAQLRVDQSDPLIKSRELIAHRLLAIGVALARQLAMPRPGMALSRSSRSLMAS